MRAPRPWHFFFLILPFGASFGAVSVALTYLARQAGISVEAIGALVAAAFAPHTPKFLWAPVVDVTWSRKGWYLLALALVALGTAAALAMPITPGSLPALTAVVVVSQVGLTLMGMACEGLIGQGLAPERKGAASGWFQAGSFFGLGVGGGAALETVKRLGGPATGAILGVAMATCALPLLGFDEAREAHRERLRDALRALGRDLRDLVRAPGGVAALVICVSPIGAGAAGNLFAAIADDWGASRELVALTIGAAGGVVSAAGAGAGGWLAARVGGRFAYALAGALTGASAVLMAASPHVPWTFAVLTLVYQACNGVALASFSAFAFAIAGNGAVATKYNVLASLANLAILYTTRAESAAHGRWGGGGVLWTDAAMTAAGLAVLALVSAPRFRRSARPRPPAR